MSKSTDLVSIDSKSEVTTLVKEFDPHRVRPLPDQPRKRFFGIEKLAKGIATNGQIQSGIVTLIDNDPDFEAQLVDGERRLRACKLANKKFRAEIQATPGDYQQQFLNSLAANFQKQDHDCIEIANALSKANKEGKKTFKELADTCGKSVGWVNQHLSLLKLHPDVQSMLIPQEEEPEGDVIEDFKPEEAIALNDKDRERKKVRHKLTFSLALLLTSVPQEKQMKLAWKITSENMSLTAARRLIYKELQVSGEIRKSKRGPSEMFSSLYSLIHQANDRFGIFIDMPRPDLEAIIDSTDDDGKIELAETLEDLAENIRLIAQDSRKRISSKSLKSARRLK